MAALAEEIGALLQARGLTLGAVESATGGLISALITDIPGSSDYYKGSVTAYANEVKVGVVGVSAESIARHGAVSARVAEEMAQGGRRVLGVDICLADTGIAGPGGSSPDKPVGLFYIGLATPQGVESRRHIFKGDRRQNRLQAAETALRWLKEYLSRPSPG